MLYIVFSRKFKAKTGLSLEECFHFINSQPGDMDVVSFSSFYDLRAILQKGFFQTITGHPGSHFAIEEL